MRNLNLLFLCLAMSLYADDDRASYVNTFIGTANGAPDYNIGNGAGDTPPGAASPFGMVLWSPDTTTMAGGYRYDHTKIQGFSLTHFSGRGISCYQDFPVMPIVGSVTDSPGSSWSSYSATFDHANEQAAPGYYSVAFDNGIRTELAVTTRTGSGRFTFPAATGTLLVNTGGSANGNLDEGTGVEIVSPNRIIGSAVSGNCGGWFTYKVYFAMNFDRGLSDFGIWNGDHIGSHEVRSTGAKSGMYLTFDTSESAVVQVKIGLSFVSAENAEMNLQNENPDWDFDAVRARARAAWNNRLSRIQVEGGTDAQKTVFYTALYHATLHPNTFSDSNGDYLGFDNQVHHANGFTQYHNFPCWDDYRSLMPLLAMIAPEASGMMQSLVNDAQQDPGGGLPRWQHANTNSGGMIGDGPDAVIATVYALGARDFDAWSALNAMDKGASQIGTTSGGQVVREGLADYLNLGYVPTTIDGSAARTLEYVTSDFSIAQLANALGDKDRYRAYLKRAQNWKRLFHNGYIVPRNPDGSFEEITPTDCCNDFTEGSPAQYVWSVPFNLRGLFDAMGGDAAAVQRLDRHFTQLNAGPGSEYAFMGNEPELKTPWMYNFAGAPWRSQEVVRRIVLQLFANSPGGMPGNDDGGVLSAWLVFASMGIYPEIPGAGGFAVGSPLFPQITVQLANGSVIRVNAAGASDGKAYVQSLKLNGQEYNSPWMTWDKLAGSADLDFTLGEQPNLSWGKADPIAPSYDSAGN